MLLKKAFLSGFLLLSTLVYADGSQKKANLVQLLQQGEVEFHNDVRSVEHKRLGGGTDTWSEAWDLAQRTIVDAQNYLHGLKDAEFKELLALAFDDAHKGSVNLPVADGKTLIEIFSEECDLEKIKVILEYNPDLTRALLKKNYQYASEVAQESLKFHQKLHDEPESSWVKWTTYQYSEYTPKSVSCEIQQGGFTSYMSDETLCRKTIADIKKQRLDARNRCLEVIPVLRQMEREALRKVFAEEMERVGGAE